MNKPLKSNRTEDQGLNTYILRATGSYTVHSTFNGPFTTIFPFSKLLDYLAHIIIIVITTAAATPTFRFFAIIDINSLLSKPVFPTHFNKLKELQPLPLFHL